MHIWQGWQLPDPLRMDDDAGASILAAVYSSSQRSTPAKELRQGLPVRRHRQELLFLLERHPVVIVVGQTGSGKTTQIPQCLYEAGWTSAAQMVVCTQPRRLAATTVAARVAEERDTVLGTLVGYAVRFEDRTAAETTRIKYMTDGLLVREAMFDPLLSRYSVIMVDEAHERSLHTELLLGLLKKIMRRRPELRVIVSSATLDADEFAKYFTEDRRAATRPALDGLNVPDSRMPAILALHGRIHPVAAFYLPEHNPDYVEEAVRTTCNIHASEEEGDILVFLTGRHEIERAVAHLREQADTLLSRQHTRLLPIPLCAGLPLDHQIKAFEAAPRGYRKAIVATNIAEASVTIEDVVYVVDAGMVKLRVYDPHKSTDRLVVAPISRAAAQQRAGRAGRVRPGKVFRLYSESDYTAFPPNSIPEIQRCNLTPVVLQLKALGIGNLLGFDFMAQPSAAAMARALETLYALGAIDLSGALTEPLGLTMAELPLEPMLARMLIASREYGCGAEMATIAAMVAVQNVVSGPRPKYAVEEGDLVTYLNIYRGFLHNAQSERWCQRNRLHYQSLLRAHHVRGMLVKYMRRLVLPLDSTQDMARVQKCVAAGLFCNAATANGDGSYTGIRDGSVLHVHPNSALFRRVPSCVVYCDVVETTKVFMCNVTAIEPSWLPEISPLLYEYRRVR